MKKSFFIILLIIIGICNVSNSAELSINEYLNLVEKNNQDIKYAVQETEMANAQKKEATALALPHIDAQADYRRNLKDYFMYIDLGEGTSKIKSNYDNDYAFNVTMTQTLFSGQVFNAIKASRQYEKLTDYVYQSTWQQLITASKQMYYQTLLLKKLWDVSADAENNALDNFNDVKKAYDNGLVSEYELLQAEVRYRDAIPRTTTARRNYEVALVELKNLAGLPLDDDFTLSGTLDKYPEIPAVLSLDSIFTTRPDFQALNWEEDLRQTGVRAEKSAYFPALGAFAAYDYSASSNEWSLENDNNSVTVGLSLAIPLFKGGETRSKVKQASVELEKVRIRKQKAKQDISSEVKNYRIRLLEAYERIKAARTTMETARKAFTIAEATAQSGLTTQLQLKDSRIALDNADVYYYSAVFEYLATYFEWERISGNVDLLENKW